MLDASTYLRTSVTEWIKHKLAATLGRELEQLRHRLATELETHKSGILRELERYRADIDIHRTIRLRLADARLDALRTLAGCLDEYVNEAAMMPVMEAARRRSNFDAYIASLTVARTALRAADIFITRELAVEISGMMREAHRLCADLDAPPIPTDAPQIADVLRRCAAVLASLRGMLNADALVGEVAEAQ